MMDMIGTCTVSLHSCIDGGRIFTKGKEYKMQTFTGARLNEYYAKNDRGRMQHIHTFGDKSLGTGFTYKRVPLAPPSAQDMVHALMNLESMVDDLERKGVCCGNRAEMVKKVLEYLQQEVGGKE